MTIVSSQVPESIAKNLVHTSEWISQKIPAWVQGAGGNVSGKDLSTDSIWIKASGLRLDEISAKKGLVQLSLSKYRSGLTSLLQENSLSKETLEKSYADGITEAVVGFNDPSFARASMETGFHALFDFRYVAHFHALSAVIMADLWFKEDIAFSKWKQKHLPRVVFINWEKPGFELVKAIAQGPRQPITVVRNHGVILAAEAFEEFKMWEHIENEFMDHFGFGEFSNCGASEVNLLTNIFPNLRLGPLRFFFPDTAVFLPRLEKNLKILNSAGRPLKDEEGRPMFEFLSTSNDRDALELWLATQMLHQKVKDTEELPADFVSAVALLPTEKYRIAIRTDAEA